MRIRKYLICLKRVGKFQYMIMAILEPVLKFRLLQIKLKVCKSKEILT